MEGYDKLLYEIEEGRVIGNVKNKRNHLSLIDMVDYEHDFYKCIGLLARVIYLQIEDKENFLCWHTRGSYRLDFYSMFVV